MAALVVLALGAIAMPWFSSRVWPFVLWSAGAAGMLVLGMYLCAEGARGWDGLACVVFAFLAAFPVAASVAVGIVRVVSTGGGKRRANRRAVILAAAISYGIAVISVALLVGFGR